MAATVTTRKQVHITQPLLNAIPEAYLPRLDPAYIAYYNEYRAGRLCTHQVPIAEFRANPQRYMIVVGRRLGPEVHRVSHRGVPVGADGAAEITLRVYEPDDDGHAGGKKPVYVNLHGGGWVFGDLSADDAFCRWVVKHTGAVVFNVDYRLAPEYPFPVPVEDSIATFKWVIAHLDEYNIDPARVAVGGLSAGGHMAAIIAHVCRDEGIPLAFQLLAVPAVDLTAWTPESDKIAPDCPYDSYRDLWDVPELSLERMKFFVNHFLGGPRPPEYDNNWKLSPIKAPNFAGLAPALIVTAELDILRDEAGAYAKKMNDAGSQAELLCIKGVPHPFLMLDDILEGAQEYQAAAMAALNKAFGTPVAK